MIIVKIFDPSVKPEPFIKEIRYSTADWDQTKAIAAAIQEIVDKSVGGIDAE